MGEDRHIFISWSNPLKIKTKYGLKWTRSWVIPDELLQGFFLFWDKRKDKLRLQGYSVSKNHEGKWTLFEWQERRSDFKAHFGKDNADIDLKDAVSSLPPYEVRCKDGLKEWQIPNVAKLCASILTYGAAFDGSDTGSGKTYTAVGVARDLGMKIGVVCPKAVISAWKKVITKHFGMTPEFVLNYESVKTGNHPQIGEWVPESRTKTTLLFQWNIPKDTLLIFDESHKLKGKDTQNSAIALAAHRQGYKMLCCSATNAVNPIELRTVGLILGLYRKGKWTKFLEEHGCENTDYGWEFNGDRNVLRKLHLDIFLNRGVRIKKENIPGFPDCETIAEAYNMKEEDEFTLNRIYADMENEINLIKLKCKSISEQKAHALTAQLRYRQKAEIVKVPLMVDMAEEAIEDGMSVAIFVNFIETASALMKRLKTNCVIWGQNKGDEREKNIEAFQSDESRIIIVLSAAGGTGVSLHDLNGNYPRMSIISPHPSAVILKQVLGRIHRAEAKTKALQKIVFVANTAEEDVCDRLKMKLENLDMINDGDLSESPIFREGA